jgi:hypothetical protein
MFAIFGEAFNGFTVLYAVFFGEDVERRFSGGSVRRQADFTQVLLHFRLHRERNLVQYIDCLMKPTTLVARPGEDLLDRLPKAERAVANRDFRGNAQPTAFQVDEKLAPTLGASRTPTWKPMSSFLPSGVAPSSTSMQSLCSSMRACR